MAKILDYFDTINIDVAKRKYYNVNKVNAVLEELRKYAVELVEENESLRTALEEQKSAGNRTRESMDALQGVYRETLEKAHERADTMIREAEEKSTQLTEEAERRTEITVRQVEECINAIRTREEQNIAFLNARLQQFHSELRKEEPVEEEPRITAPAQPQPEKEEVTPAPEPVSPQEAPEEDSDLIKELEQRISELAREINSLEEEE